MSGTPSHEAHGVWIGVATWMLDTHAARSLKDKRGIITPIVERLRQRYPVSVARLDHLDTYTSERLGMVVMNQDPAVCRQVLERALAFVESFGHRTFDVTIDVERWD